MNNYNLYCFDFLGSCVCRDSFEADDNAQARAIAGAIRDACADEHHSYELWKDDLPIDRGETLAVARETSGLSGKVRKVALNRMVALCNSDWPIGKSRRLRQKIEAWTSFADDSALDAGEPCQMRQFRRGVEFFIHSPDGAHWKWFAALKTPQGERVHGTVNGTRTLAIKLCIAAIDEALAERGGKNQSSAQTPQADLAEAGEVVQIPAQTRQVLVAEDEALFRDATAALLKSAGFEVFQASDGEEALMILKENPRISLLISDVRMPHMDGYALVEAGLGLNPDLQVILMTGYANTPSKYVQDRKIDTLRKPVDLDLLRSHAEKLSGRASLN